MIDIKSLTDADKGRWVEYTPPFNGKKWNGRIKSWNDHLVFVVFNCDGFWENYAEYTAEATAPNYLEFKEYL